jgi:GT2 family glycosyltransferase
MNLIPGSAEVCASPASNKLSPLFTVVICTRNRAGYLHQAIASVLPQLTADSELLIVDNASTDQTSQVANQAERANAQVRVVLENEPGLSAARNRALLEAKGKYVFFLDDDALAEPGWLNAYRHFLTAPPAEKIAVVGGAVFPEFESPRPQWLTANADKLDIGSRPARLPGFGGAWGCNVAYLREAAIAVGKFDAKLGRNGRALGAHEETELNFRLMQAGFQIWWLPEARIRHFVSAERVRLTWRLRNEFDQSRSSAIFKLRVRRRKVDRLAFGAGRILIVPFHCALNLLLAVVALPFQDQRITVGALMRTARTAGIATELLACATARARATRATSDSGRDSAPYNVSKQTANPPAC